jgi:hypothetical protein
VASGFELEGPAGRAVQTGSAGSHPGKRGAEFRWEMAVWLHGGRVAARGIGAGRGLLAAVIARFSKPSVFSLGLGFGAWISRRLCCADRWGAASTPVEGGDEGGR